MFLIWIALTLLAGLRYKVGGDTIGYYEQYSTWPTLKEFSFDMASNSRFAIGYQLLWSTCRSINPNFWFYQLIHAVIINSTFFLLFRKTNNKTFLAVLLYYLYSYFFYNMEILRAAISVSIFIFSLKFYFEKQWLRYYIYAVLALLFHTESIVLFLFPFVLYLNSIQINQWRLICIIVLSFVLLNAIDFIPIVNNIIVYLGVMEDGLAGFYAMQRDYNINGLIAVLMQILPIVILLYLYRNDAGFKLKGFLILNIILTILTLKYSVFFGRVNDFLTPLVIFSMANIFSKKINITKKNIALKLSMITLYVFMIFFNYTKNTYYPEYKKYYPYSSVINPQENQEREWYVRDIITNR